MSGSSDPVVTRSFGPFVKGLVDTWPASAGNPQGALRRAEGVYLWGEGQLRSLRFPWYYEFAAASPSGDPHTHLLAAVNAIGYGGADTMYWYVLAFEGTGASADVRKLQLYLLSVPAAWWYGRTNGAISVGSGLALAATVGTIGTSTAVQEGPYRMPPTVRMVAQGLTLHIACDAVGGLYYTVDTTPGAGAMVVTAAPGGVTVRGVFLFQRHLWGYGGATRTDGGKLWFGAPDYGALTTAGGQSFQLPDYSQGINSIYQVVVIRESAIICTARGYYRLTGYGKNTWQTTKLALRLGAAGYQAACSGPDAAYVMDSSGHVWACSESEVVPLPRVNSMTEAGLDLAKAVLGFDEQNQWLIVTVPLSQLSPLRSYVWVYSLERAQWITAKLQLGLHVGATATFVPNDVHQTYTGQNNPPLATAPTLTSVTPTGGGNVSVVWSVPTTAATPKLPLEVKRTADGETAWEVWHDINIGAGSPTTVGGFTPGVSYDFRLWLDFYTANRSAFSAVVTAVAT